MTTEIVLPSDLAACHAIIRDQAKQIEDQKARVVKAEAERDAALQLAFRKKIERYLADPKQFVLDFGDTPDIVDAAEGIADAALETIDGYERRKQAKAKPRNEQLPAHLLLTAVENGGAGRSKMVALGSVGLPDSVGVSRLVRSPCQSGRRRRRLASCRR